MKKLFLMLMLCAPLSLFAQQKFGHVDLDKVIQSLPEYTTAMQELEALGKQYEQELTASQAELQRLAEEYDKTKSTLTGGYVYIMSNGSLPYINDSISKDVTSDVKAQLSKK